MLIRNNSLEKEPTSKLIYHLVYPSEQELKVEEALFARLQKKYQLDKRQSEYFVEVEQATLKIRGENIYSYLFGTANTGEQCLRQFYRREQHIDPNLLRKNHFNGFTFSELAILTYLFQLLEMMFYNRMVNLGKKGLDVKEAKYLSEYYGFLKNLVSLKMDDLIELCSDKENAKAYRKEAKFMKQYTSEFQRFALEAIDLSINPFEKHKQIAEEVGAKVFLFK